MADSACASATSIYRGRIISVLRQPGKFGCVVASGAKVRLPLVLASHIAIGDEISFPIPDGDGIRSETYVEKAPSSGARTCLYQATIGPVTQPKLDKHGGSFVSAQVPSGNLGISSVFLPCETLRDYFYCMPSTHRGLESATLYDTLRVMRRASPAEIRVAFKLRALELKSIGAARAEHVKLERAFNILGHPELRAHYDSLLCAPGLPAFFPYGGVGSLLVAGYCSRSGETFFARRILAFVPDQTQRRFHLPFRNCEFYADKALCRDVRRNFQCWLDHALLNVAWDPSWNRWKHLISSKLEVDGAFVRSGGYKKGSESWEFGDWETALPSRISVKLPAAFQEDIERARSMYCRFGRYSPALDKIRLCLEHKAIEQKDLQRMCSELGIPGDFDVAQISWRPDYDPFFYRALSRRARRIYLFRDEYIFDLEKAVVVETPQLGHATYVFSKPANMEKFLALYSKIGKEHIRRNRDNIGGRLRFLGRVIHSKNPSAWLDEMCQRLGEMDESVVGAG